MPEQLSAAKATLKELSEARERRAAAAAAVTKEEEEAAARQAAITGLQDLFEGANTTRSKLKSALRKAQTVGIDRAPAVTWARPARRVRHGRRSRRPSRRRPRSRRRSRLWRRWRAEVAAEVAAMEAAEKERARLKREL